MKKLLPIILGVVGLSVGVGAGAFLQPKPDEDLTMHACAACVREKRFELPPVSFIVT